MSSKSVIVVTLVIIGIILSSSSGIQSIPLASTPDAEFGKYNIILLIGDGMGWNQMYYGAIVEYGNMSAAIYDDFEYQVNVSTQNYESTTTDSAAAATAIATGVLTNNGILGMTHDLQPLNTITESYISSGFATGLVTTVYVQHATPAAFISHQPNRGVYTAIASDMADSGIDLLFGGGRHNSYFGTVIDQMEGDGYTYIQNLDTIENDTLPLLGLFSSSDLPDEIDRTNTTNAPRLSEMAQVAIDRLEGTGDPFFLMVEGGKIDWASHDNDPPTLAHEQIEFEKTIRLAYNYVDSHPNTLLIVTADHETGGITDLTFPSTYSQAIPLETDDLMTKISKRTSRASEIDITWSSTSHSDQQIIAAAKGHNAELITSASHNKDVFAVMNATYGDNFVPLTTSTTSSTTSVSSVTDTSSVTTNTETISSSTSVTDSSDTPFLGITSIMLCIIITNRSRIHHIFRKRA